MSGTIWHLPDGKTPLDYDTVRIRLDADNTLHIWPPGEPMPDRQPEPTTEDIEAAVDSIVERYGGALDALGGRQPEPTTEALLSRHVADPTTGVHRGPLPDESLTYACAECDMDWPCDAVQVAKAAKAVLDWDEKERWGGPHDWLADVIGYYR